MPHELSRNFISYALVIPQAVMVTKIDSSTEPPEFGYFDCSMPYSIGFSQPAAQGRKHIGFSCHASLAFSLKI